MTEPSRRLACLALALAPCVLAACPEREISSGDAGEPGPVECEELRESIDQLQLEHSREVDLLFVIDNSGSMAEEQARLASAAGALIERLDAAGADYRIGFTTSDNSNPWCPVGTTTPEGGKLVLSPCTTRLGDFLFGDTVDARDLACNDLCGLDEAALAITPTITDLDPEPTPRPWLERINGDSNLPTETAMADAFACFAPQGVNGCGFESQLESMYLALIRSQAADQAQYGFLRAGAVLAVVIVSDEADCSYNKNFSQIFDADGDKTFWSDPSAAFPTSAVCWNAGVECSGDPSGYDACEPADKALNGSLTGNPSDAVLQPMARYQGLLDGLEQETQTLHASREQVFMLIAGVEGSGEDWSVSYADAADPEVQIAYGIGPGCTDADGQIAVPPVRMRALAEAIDPLGLHSVCAADYSAAMAGLGERIAEQFRPLCYTKCVADGDLSTPQFEPSCTLEQRIPGNQDSTRIPECVRGPDGVYAVDPGTQDYALPDDADVCYAMLTDVDGENSDPLDDMSADCVDLNYNLEFRIVRRPGGRVPSGTSISADCGLADCPEQDCPGIGAPG